MMRTSSRTITDKTVILSVLAKDLAFAIKLDPSRTTAQDDSPPGNRRAFTLIELLLAMAISAALAAALYMAMTTAYRAKQSAESAALPASAGAIAMDLICHDLGSVVPPPPSDPSVDITGNTPNFLSGPFEGTHQSGGGQSPQGGDLGNDDLIFRTVAHDDSPNANDPLSEGIRQVEFLIRNDTNPPSLVRRVTRNVFSTNQQAYADEVLCRNVRGFTCKYFDGTEWQTDWDSTQLGDVLPTAVSIEIDIDDPRATARPGQAKAIRALTRVVPIPCAKPIPSDVTTP